MCVCCQCIDQLTEVQAELQESVKDLTKSRKKYQEAETMAQAVREKAELDAKYEPNNFLFLPYHGSTEHLSVHTSSVSGVVFNMGGNYTLKLQYSRKAGLEGTWNSVDSVQVTVSPENTPGNPKHAQQRIEMLQKVSKMKCNSSAFVPHFLLIKVKLCFCPTNESLCWKLQDCRVQLYHPPTPRN